MLVGGMSNNFTIPVSNVDRVTPINVDNTVDSSAKITKPTECKTCQNRRYQDGSDENVSYKTPGVIRPEESFAKVSAHEKEHVANAIVKASKPNAKLVSVSVSLKTGVCPECGRVYVAGGTTRSQIKYSEKSPYEANRKAFEKEALTGGNFDAAV